MKKVVPVLFAVLFFAYAALWVYQRGFSDGYDEAAMKYEKYNHDIRFLERRGTLAAHERFRNLR